MNESLPVKVPCPCGEQVSVNLMLITEGSPLRCKCGATLKFDPSELRETQKAFKRLITE